jgi:formylglycine-generating enzyme required for sulfatase activity
MAVLALALAVARPATAIGIDWVFVGSPGNPSDPEVSTQKCGDYEQPCGAVAGTYLIGKYEVTNAQYAAFLNAVAVSDPNGLYTADMGLLASLGGITRTGSDGSYSYAVIAGRGDLPVNNVTWYSAVRFANWLHNGQPTGAQGLTTTEGGAYTLPIPPARNPGALYFLPTEDEWYKAAYYSGSGNTYFKYPAGSNTQTSCVGPTAAANSANCNDAVGDLVEVGSYPGTVSPFGTYDQGGNVYEWTETDVFGDLGARNSRGGSSSYAAIFTGAEERTDFFPTMVQSFQGFRVAPEPRGDWMLLAGALVLGLVSHRRR